MESRFIKVLSREGYPIYINLKHVISIRYNAEVQCVVVDLDDRTYFATSINLEDFNFKASIY